MKRPKITKIKSRPEYQQQQRFIDFAGADDFHWRFTRLVAALELLAIEPPSEEVGYAGVIDSLAEVARKIEEEFFVVLQNIYTPGPGKDAGIKVWTRAELEVIRTRSNQARR